MLSSLVLSFALLVPTALAEAAPAHAPVAVPCSPQDSTYEVASWSTSPEVTEYTNELIRLNPKAQLLIVGRTTTLTGPTGSSLVRPEGEVPAGVSFRTVKE